MTPPRPRDPTRDAGCDPRRWTIMGISMAIVFMSLLDVTIVNIAVPSMAASLGASTGTIQWVVSGYALAFGMTLVTGGRLGDALGRRPLMMIGLLGFMAGSLASGLAPTVGVLIAARLVQGAMAGMLVPQNGGIIQTYFHGSERGRAFGLMGLAVGISSAFGPVVGGLILAAAGGQDGWRWIFLVNVPIALALLLAVWRTIPGRQSEAPADIDVVGATLIGLTVAAVIFPLSRLGEGPAWQLAIALAAPPLAWAVLVWERRSRRLGRTPVLNLEVLGTVPGYAGGALIGALYFTGYISVLLVFSVYLQTGLGLSPLAAALHMTPLAVVTAIGGPISGRLVGRFGRRTTIVALSLLTVALASTATLIPLVTDPQGRTVMLVCSLAFIGLGAGAVVSPNYALALDKVPVAMGGAATAAIQTGQRMGTALGAALLMMTYGLTERATGDADTAMSTVLWVSTTVISLTTLAAVLDHRSAARAADAP